MPDFYSQEFKPDFDKLWEDYFSAVYQSWARRNVGLLRGSGDAGDLFAKLWEFVWLPLVRKWPTYVLYSEKPDVTAFSGYLLKRYFINLKIEMNSKQLQMIRSEKPLTHFNEFGEDEGDDSNKALATFDFATLNNLTPLGLETLLNDLEDPTLKPVLKLLVDNLAKNRPIMRTWKTIEKITGQSYGWVRKRLQEEPALQEFFKTELAAPRTQHKKPHNPEDFFMGEVDDGYGQKKDEAVEYGPSESKEEEGKVPTDLF